MKKDHRTPSPEVIAVKVPSELATAIKRRAREDDRTVSGYLRRLLAAAVQHAAPPDGSQP
jgi:hypothetical protein